MLNKSVLKFLLDLKKIPNYKLQNSLKKNKYLKIVVKI